MKIIWKNLKELASRDFDNVPRKSGIYFLRWARNGNPVKINRLTESDYNGLLYVGESKDLKSRFKRIWNGVNLEKKSSIKNIDSLRKTIFFCKIHEVIKIDEYEITWQQLTTNIEVESQEAAALKLYTKKFKEPPPMNLQFCREKYAIWGLGKWDDSKWLVEPNDFVKSVIE
jgi:hypothetical protein